MNEIHKVLRKKERNKLEYKITVPDMGWLCIDLMVMEKEARQNKGFSYGMVIIDIYSRYGWCIPIKNKTAKTTAEAFEKWYKGGYKTGSCFKTTKPFPIVQLRHDSGGEWAGAFAEFCEKNGIEQRWIEPTDYHHSMGINDRFILTLRQAILKRWISQRNFDWITPLSEVLEEYNARFHRGIQAIPCDVVSGSEVPAQTVKRVPELKAGDFVRIMVHKRLFDKKTSLQNWSSKVYRIEKKDGLKYLLEGGDRRYGRWELLRTKAKADTPHEDMVAEAKVLAHQNKIRKDFVRDEVKSENIREHKTRLPQNVYEVEKILASKKDRKTHRRLYLVKWKGYDDKDNSWLPAKDIGDDLLKDFAERKRR